MDFTPSGNIRRPTINQRAHRIQLRAHFRDVSLQRSVGIFVPRLHQLIPNLARVARFHADQ